MASLGLVKCTTSKYSLKEKGRNYQIVRYTLTGAGYERLTEGTPTKAGSSPKERQWLGADNG